MMKRIVDMEQLVGTALEELIIDVSESRILLRDLELALFIFFEDSLNTLFLAGVAGRRLTATADAPVRAGHDFDEVKVLFATFDLFDQLV